MTRKNRKIPKSVIQRMTRYLTYLQTLQGAGVEWVSSQEIADALGLTSSTVRQDLSYIDFSGISKRGYATEGLQEVLSRVLGADTGWRMVVVGAGNLGRALAVHEDFARRGFMICGVFDADKEKIGRRIGPLQIQGTEELSAVVKAENVDIGIIAVPACSAQAVGDLLIASGVRGLLNLSSVHIVAPAGTPVVDARVVGSLLELTHAIKCPA